MKAQLLLQAFLAFAGFALLSGCSPQSSGTSSESSRKTGAPNLSMAQAEGGVTKAVDMIDAQNRLLIDLATERFFANSNRNQVWVFTVHTGEGVKKFTDGQHYVISLPTSRVGDWDVMRAYANSYNRRTLIQADSLVRATNYSGALQIYELLREHGCWPDAGLDPNELGNRIRPLADIIDGREVEKNFAKLTNLFLDRGFFTEIPHIETIEARYVKDLKHLNINGSVPSNDTK